MRSFSIKGQTVLVSDEDYEWASSQEWTLHGWPPYVARRAPDPSRPGKHRMVFLHRNVLIRMGYLGFPQADHINRNTLDNRRENLRPADARLNSMNRKKPRGRRQTLPDPASRPCKNCSRQFTPRRRTASMKAEFCSRYCQRVWNSHNAIGGTR